MSIQSLFSFPIIAALFYCFGLVYLLNGLMNKEIRVSTVGSLLFSLGFTYYFYYLFFLNYSEKYIGLIIGISALTFIFCFFLYLILLRVQEKNRIADIPTEKKAMQGAIEH
jgi:GT2 family glycosyltransferase